MLSRIPKARGSPVPLKHQRHLDLDTATAKWPGSRQKRKVSEVRAHQLARPLRLANGLLVGNELGHHRFNVEHG